MNTPIGLDSIPGPRGVPLLGNVFDLDAADPIDALVRMTGEYGPLYKLTIPGGVRRFVSGPTPSVGPQAMEVPTSRLELSVRSRYARRRPT